MKVLVTGPFGNVGAHTLPELRRQGHAVRVLARLSTVNRKAAKAHGVEVVIEGPIHQPCSFAWALSNSAFFASAHLRPSSPPQRSQAT